jgi:HEAT repeat protein
MSDKKSRDERRVTSDAKEAVFTSYHLSLITLPEVKAMLRSSRSKSLTFVLAVVTALFSAALVVARQAQESRPTEAGARERAAALRSADALKRAAAAYEISKRPHEAKALVGVLIELLGDATQVDPASYRKREPWGNENMKLTVGREAARALTAAGADAVEPLIGALARNATEARASAAWALGAIGDRRAVLPLTETLRRDADETTREQAAWALGAIGDESAVEGLSAALSDASGEVQEQAAWALGAIGDARATAALGGALKSRDVKVREQAAWALGAIGDESAVPSLIALLSDENARVREQTAWALGAIGDARATNALRASLRDSDKGVREQVRWALGVVDDKGKDH